MVHAKSVLFFKEIYGHRSRADGSILKAPHRRSTDRAMPNTPVGYSDTFMAEMNFDRPGQVATRTQHMPPFGIVAEHNLNLRTSRRETNSEYDSMVTASSMAILVIL